MSKKSKKSVKPSLTDAQKAQLATDAKIAAFNALSIGDAIAVSKIVAVGVEAQLLGQSANMVATAIKDHSGQMIGNAVLNDANALRDKFHAAIKDLPPERTEIISDMLSLLTVQTSPQVAAPSA